MKRLGCDHCAGAIGLLRDDPELKRVKVLMDISHVESLRYIIEVGDGFVSAH